MGQKEYNVFVEWKSRRDWGYEIHPTMADDDQHAREIVIQKLEEKGVKNYRVFVRLDFVEDVPIKKPLKGKVVNNDPPNGGDVA